MNFSCFWPFNILPHPNAGEWANNGVGSSGASQGHSTTLGKKKKIEDPFIPSALPSVKFCVFFSFAILFPTRAISGANVFYCKFGFYSESKSLHLFSCLSSPGHQVPAANNTWKKWELGAEIVYWILIKVPPSTLKSVYIEDIVI